MKTSAVSGQQLLDLWPLVVPNQGAGRRARRIAMGAYGTRGHAGEVLRGDKAEGGDEDSDGLHC